VININIVNNDSRQVAKVVIIDDHNRVLMLKRSNYMDKYAGEWDLPGGHIRVGEDFLVGMKREVKEETNLDVENLKFIEKIDNLDFYYCKYNNRPIKMSHEHVGFRFFDKKKLDSSKKFEKVAIKALEMNNG
jgi:8-oxo-dGTP pyrophosphatase MutT (NUDIX family)